MLSSGFAESTTKTIELNCSGKVAKYFKKYIYTAKFEGYYTSRDLFELYSLADQYMFDDLKKLTKDALCTPRDVRYVFFTLKILDEYLNVIGIDFYNEIKKTYISHVDHIIKHNICYIGMERIKVDDIPSELKINNDAVNHALSNMTVSRCVRKFGLSPDDPDNIDKIKIKIFDYVMNERIKKAKEYIARGYICF
jgi:hypothetical protein